jgi:hypothetical protein
MLRPPLSTFTVVVIVMELDLRLALMLSYPADYTKPLVVSMILIIMLPPPLPANASGMSLAVERRATSHYSTVLLLSVAG